MLGQQSSAEFAGLHIDVMQIGELNRNKEGLRKCGVLIHTGAKLTRQEILDKIGINKQLYELPREEYEDIQIDDLQVRERELVMKMKQLRVLRMQLGEVERKMRELTDKNLDSLPICTSDSVK